MRRKDPASDLEAKLLLRRHFLARLAAAKTPVHVLDCCAGDGLIWSKLRAEFEVASYFGMDKKRRSGRLKVDSSRILAMPGWTQNIVDIDTFGSPWNHFVQLLNTCRHSVIVFLTWSSGRMPRVARAETELVGLGNICLPRGLQANMVKLVLPHALASAKRRGFRIGECREAFPQDGARIIGVELIWKSGKLKAEN